jgi:putative aldouronate transport system substrate-binding protein
MKTKRIIGLVLSAMLAASVLAGCNKKEPATNPNTDGKPAPVTFTLFNGFTDSMQFPQDNDLYKWVQEQTGVTIKVDYIVGDLPTKIGVMIASGDYPDLIWGHEHHQKFVDAGAAVPLNDYIEKYGSNIKKVYGPMLKKLTQDDGKIYFFAPYREGINNVRVGRGFHVQKRVLEEAGYPKITNLDDYFKLLTDYQKKYPQTEGKDTIAFSFITDSWRFFTLTNAASDLRGFTNDGFTQVDPKTMTAKAYGTNEDSKNYFKKLNELWNAGGIDREAFTINYDQYISKLTAGRVLGFYDQWWQFNDAQLSLATQKKFEYQYVALPIVWDDSVKERYQTPSVPIVRDGISISTKCKDPERAFKFIDFLMSEEVQKRISWGEKDVEYKVDDKGMFYRTAEMREMLKSEDYRKKRGIGAFGYPWPVQSDLAKFSDGNWWVPDASPLEIAEGYTDSDRVVLDAYGVKTYGEMFNQDKGNPWGEGWDIPVPDGSPVQITMAKVDELTKNYVPKAIMAAPGRFDAVWEEYVKEYNKLDIKAVEEFYEKAIKDRVAKWN